MSLFRKRAEICWNWELSARFPGVRKRWYADG